MERLKKMPVPMLPTFVGALTISNVWNGLGFAWIRHLMMWTGIVILLVYIVKLVSAPDVTKEEYKNTVQGSLYAGFFMMTMILGAYIYDYIPVVGTAMLWIGVVCQAGHIIMFTIRNVMKGINWDTFVPSWFVTYNGIMVSCVVGSAILPKWLCTGITWYGIVIYLIIMPFMLFRLFTREVKKPVYHTMAVVLAPCSLCLVSYLNVIEAKNDLIVYFLYFCVFCSLLFVLFKLPKFFAFNFVPGYAGITFPMAIGCAATGKMAAFITKGGNEALGNMFTQIQGIQIFITTMIIGWVLMQFLIMFMKLERH